MYGNVTVAASRLNCNNHFSEYRFISQSQLFEHKNDMKISTRNSYFRPFQMLCHVYINA